MDPKSQLIKEAEKIFGMQTNERQYGDGFNIDLNPTYFVVDYNGIYLYIRNMTLVLGPVGSSRGIPVSTELAKQFMYAVAFDLEQREQKDGSKDS